MNGEAESELFDLFGEEQVRRMVWNKHAEYSLANFPVENFNLHLEG